MRRGLKFLWRSWKGVIHRINSVIAFVLMSVAYIIALAPVAIGFKILRRDLTDRGDADPDIKSFWGTFAQEELDIQLVQRQY